MVSRALRTIVIYLEGVSSLMRVLISTICSTNTYIFEKNVQ